MKYLKGLLQMALVVAAAIGIYMMVGYFIYVPKAKEVTGHSRDKYAYNLLNEEEQIVYDQIRQGLLDYDSEIVLSAKDVETVNRVLEHIRKDYGDVFWSSHGDLVTTKHLLLPMSIKYVPTYDFTLEEKNRLQDQVDAVIQEWLSGLKGTEDDYDKVKYVYETVINHTEYEEDSPNNQNILSVFLNGKSVCAGYSKASLCLLSELGIDSFMVTGTTNTGGAHGWNMVKIDGDYYCYDATWGELPENSDMSIEGMVNYSFLNITSDEAALSRTDNGEIVLPVANSIKDNYYVREGLYMDHSDAEEIGKLISDNIDLGEEGISLKFSNSDLYNEAVDRLFEDEEIFKYTRGIRSITYRKNAPLNIINLKFNRG